ncbi:MAG TPA: metallophosphoesterase, partial [Candidatus Binatia bacterium]|nr:metallophosphoesterase [Candidatus Binatia bacterium]
ASCKLSRRMRTVGLTALVVALGVAVAAARQRVDYAFTVVAPRSVSRSQLVARVVIVAPGARCPVIVARTAERKKALRIRMRRIATPGGSVGFDGITVCRKRLPRGVVRASVGGNRLPVFRPGTPKRIAVFGDTGCRIEEREATPDPTEPTEEVQDCNSPTAWPLEMVAGEIAAAKPQLVIDTGDYFYREAACPTSGPQAPLCAGSPPPNPPGSPNEDTWAGWAADWFRPARALFRAAPLVLSRGNHESCARAGTGYFFLLEPGVSPPDTCQRADAATGDPANPPPSVAQPPWVARFGAIDLVVYDSSNANDTTVKNAEMFEALGRRAVSLLRPRSFARWLLTHRPVYGWGRFAGPDRPPIWTNVTLEAALDGLIGPFDAVLSGHVHLFQTVELPDRPAQLILGDGGTLLDSPDIDGALPTFGPTIDGMTLAAPTRGVMTVSFGWMLFRPTPEPGVFSGVRSQPGVGPQADCRLARDSIDCTPR